MAKTKKRAKIFETKYFGLIIGLFIVVLFTLFTHYTTIPANLELKVLDLHFNLKMLFRSRSLQEGVTIQERNPNISEDILIVGIDFNSLSRFGRWPFPRYRWANLLDSLARIQNQEERERAVFLDIFYIEPADNAYNDALLVESIENSGRVFLETVLSNNPPPPGTEEEMFRRQHTLYEQYGYIENVYGDWENMRAFHGLQPPLVPYAEATNGYGHANYVEDADKVYRRQPLIAKSSELVERFRLEELTVNTAVNYGDFERLAWIDSDGFERHIPHPLTPEVLAQVRRDMQEFAPLKTEDTDGDGVPDDYYYVIRRYRDRLVPAITLSLALEYFNKSLDDVTVVLGESITIPSPEHFDIETQQWVPYEITEVPAEMDSEGNVITPAQTRVLEEINIPINESGQMIVNFMGMPSSSDGYQTFPVRSFSGYASRVPSPAPSQWPRTKLLGNTLVMVGPFAKGIAEDEKPTPYGLMYGIEIHANALNTIVMDRFLDYAPWWVDFLILFGFVMLIAFMTSRSSTLISLILSVVLILVLFITITLVFDFQAYILNFTTPAMAVFFTFLSVVVFRVMTEERDKRRIRDMFGKYVSPQVVDQILENPPELGGVDKELTVLFSDIRGFTTLSESLTPQELVNHLNLYLTAMTDLILEFRGTLDKYVGDEIMCFWGAPLPQEDHALFACKCALKQMKVLNELNESWPPEKRIDIGIGLNSGIMTVGNMGSLGRMNYTLMGDNVNLGARLEGTNKQYKTNIIISEYTYGLVKDKFIVRELDNIRVKGKNKPVLIYELIDSIEPLEPEKSEDTQQNKE
ncbi:MAG: CHASE2 domain-containing protein [Spirochaetia bacterium]